MSVRGLALRAQRMGTLFASPATWGRLIRERGWLRPRARIHPATPKEGIRATSPNEYWHIDVTVIRLLDGTRVYLHAVIDNFSRRILAWNGWLFANTLDTFAAVERLVVFYVDQHNTVMTHSAFRGQTLTGLRLRPRCRHCSRKMVEAAGIEPASESTPPGSTTCLFRGLSSSGGANTDTLPAGPSLNESHRAPSGFHAQPAHFFVEAGRRHGLGSGASSLGGCLGGQSELNVVVGFCCVALFLKR